MDRVSNYSGHKEFKMTENENVLLNKLIQVYTPSAKYLIT